MEDAWYVPWNVDCTLTKNGEKVLDIYNPRELSVWVMEEEEV